MIVLFMDVDQYFNLNKNLDFWLSYKSFLCLLILFYYMYNVFFTIFKIVHNKFTSVGFSLSQA